MRTIRSHLLLLAFGVILPVAAFSLFLTALLVEREQHTFAEGAIERLRSTMNAVDAQVQGQITALKVLASVEELQRDDIEKFKIEAAHVLRSQPEWLNVILVTPDGRQIVNTASPEAPAGYTALPEAHTALRALKTSRPAVGPIVLRPPAYRRGVDLAVPVMREGVARYALLARVNPPYFLTPIERQRLPKGWVSGLVDSNARFIARIPAVAAEKASPAFIEAISHSSEGWYRGRTTDGLDAYTAHITSGVTGWSIDLGIPAAEVLGGAKRTAWLMGAGIAASLGVGAMLALWLGRRVARPVTRIALAARTVASGEPVSSVGLERVAELQTVAIALNEAASAIRERETLVEREKRALREADRAKDEFIAMLSHELRNPLAALSSASLLLERVPPGDSRAVRAREVIKRQSGQMARLIEDLLDTSRVVMGKASLEFDVFDMGAAASALYQTWRAAGRLDRHRAVIETSPAWVRADRSRVEQIISNLLDNALKFSPEGSEVRIRVSSEGGNCCVEVSDQGAGLTPDMMERAFNLFVQSEQGLARKSGGMGIGLALVKRLTELQGGSVSVASEGEGRGATFTVRFPCVAAPTTIAEPRDEPPAIVPKKILLIDDNDDMRQIIAASLSLQGHEVFEAADGAEALEMANRLAPDVAIVDIGLPEIDGYEVARRLRGNGTTRDMALIALTGYGQARDRQKSVDAGFDEHLTKPVETDRLEITIAAVSTQRGRGSY